MKRLSNPWINIPDYQCFGCAPHNEAGLKLTFYEDGNEIVSVTPLDAKYQGWIDTLHGGIQNVMHDEICAWAAIRHYGSTGVTMSMETHFKKSVHTTDKYVILRAKVTDSRRNILTINSSLYDCYGNLCSVAQCIYYMFPPEKARNMGFSTCEPIGEDISIEDIICKTINLISA